MPGPSFASMYKRRRLTVMSRGRRSRFGARSRRSAMSQYGPLSRTFARSGSGSAQVGNLGYQRPVTGTTRGVMPGSIAEMPNFGPRQLRQMSEPMLNLDTALANYGMDTTGTVTTLNIVPIGTGNGTMEGNYAYNYALQIRGAVIVGSTTVVARGAFLLVWDKAPRGAAPAITDVLTAATVTSFQNVIFRDRFEILCRYDYMLEGSSAAPTSDSIRNVNMVVGVRRFTKYQPGVAHAIGSVQSGALYVVTVGDAAAGTAALIFQAQYRLQYCAMG